jgi:hypothetical protein
MPTPKSHERTAVENVLRAARVPLDAPEIAARACVRNVERVRAALNNLSTENRIHRFDPLPGGRLNRYAWGPAPATHTVTVRARPAGTYEGHELHPFAGRPGALEAFTVPSLQNGERVERRRPVILGSTSITRKPQ